MVTWQTRGSGQLLIDEEDQLFIRVNQSVVLAIDHAHYRGEEFLGELGRPAARVFVGGMLAMSCE